MYHNKKLFQTVFVPRSESSSKMEHVQFLEMELLAIENVERREYVGRSCIV